MFDAYKNIQKFLLPILFIMLAVTFFTRNNYRNIDNINSALLNEPVQSETGNKDIIQFTKENYEYKLTPLYDYEINGLVVSKMNYTWFSVYKTDSVFPIDLCMVWGGNVRDKIYKDKSVKFSQDMRFCFAKWSGGINFNMEEISNSHLILKNKETERKTKTISRGDQVKIKGKLVNIEAKNLGEAGKYDPDFINWESSTTREDAGAGACEVIYVEDIEILEEANPVSNSLFTLSFFVFISLIISDIVLFFIKPEADRFDVV